MTLWLRSRDANGMIHWPDGAPYLDQPCQLIAAFDHIGVEWRRYDPKP